MPWSGFERLPARATYQAEAHGESRAALAEAAAAACARTAPTLLAMQKPEGYWVGDLLADSTLESDYVLLQLWLHPPRDGEWKPPSWDRIQRARRAILARQKSDGGFDIYPDGPADVNATIKAYIALKLAGLDTHNEPLRRARDAILNLGGIQEANSYVRINLSLFGLYPKRHVPTSPVPPGFTLEERVVPGKSFKLPKRDRLSALFRQLDIALKVWATRGPEMIRKPAIREAERWILEHTRNSDGLGAIYPSMMYLIMALDALGYPRDHPDLIQAIRQYEGLLTETPDAFYFQPCVSPVWDTSIAMFALGEMGAVAPAAMRRGADWFIAKEIRRRGDWSVKRPDLEPSGWAFEFANEHYPDIDDTAMVLLALQHASASDAAAQERCERRAVSWLVGMQSGDGGWAAFDADNNWAFLNRVPFADHNAMLDPSCPDITGRVLEALCRRGFKLSDPPIEKGVGFLLETQERDGSWYGRWGVNYLYGTFLALRGLRAAQDPGASKAVWKAGKWIVSVQHEDGGWGESCASYNEGRFVPAPSTPSQTAWALLGLIAAGQGDTEALTRGVRHLVDTQKPDGTWDEHLATGTGFPNVFYLRYTLYRNYFPLLALTQARRAIEEAERALRLVQDAAPLHPLR